MTPQTKLMFCPLIVAAATLVSCDDAVGHPPDAVLAITLETDSTATEGRCQVSASDSLPLMKSGEVIRLTPNTGTDELDDLPRATDGKGGASVSCSVVEKMPGSYSVSAAVKADKKQFSLSAEIVGGEGSNASISWGSPTLSDPMLSTVCKVTVNEVLMGGGAIQLSFDCPQFLYPSDPDNVCQAVGTLVLEACDR